MKKIPYGISDYRTLIEKDYYYIDKTKYIEILEDAGEPYVFFLRPRRFGKSLFTSMLEYYYDVKCKEEFNELFGNTYIGKNPTNERNKYYVLKFNFSGINTSTRENLLQGFTENVIKGLEFFEDKYELNLDYKKDGMPSEIFNSFLGKVERKINGKVYVLIDEYDHFANELLSFQVDVFEDTISKTGFVRKWYEVLKIGTENGLVQRIYGTGVSPITLDGMTSGFNISKNKTRNVRFNECLGFTEEDVAKILKETIGENINVEKCMPVLKKYYNGYLFNKDGKNRIFNSDMILYYASEYKNTGNPPEELIDTNVASDYTKISKLFGLKNKEENLETLKQIIEGKEQSTLITSEFSLAKGFSTDDFNSLLYYLGFLTIKEGIITSVKLGVPNYVIKELYFDFFENVLKQKAEYDIDVSKIRQSIEELALEGKIENFIEIIKTVLNKLANKDFIKFDEKYIKIIMVTYFMLSKVYYVKSEYEVEGGFIDVALLPRPGAKTIYNAIFELKYLKKEGYTEAVLNEKIKTAKEEIAKYTKSEELMELPKLKKWVMVFCKDELVYLEEIE